MKMKEFYLTIGLCFLLFGCAAKNENTNGIKESEDIEQKEIEEIVPDLNPSTEEEQGNRDLSDMATIIQGRWTDVEDYDEPRVIYISDHTIEYVYFNEDEGKNELLIHEYDIEDMENGKILTESYDPQYTLRILLEFSRNSDATVLNYTREPYFKNYSEEDRRQQRKENRSEGSLKYLGPETSYTQKAE